MNWYLKCFGIFSEITGCISTCIYMPHGKRTSSTLLIICFSSVLHVAGSKSDHEALHVKICIDILNMLSIQWPRAQGYMGPGVHDILCQLRYKINVTNKALTPNVLLVAPSLLNWVVVNQTVSAFEKRKCRIESEYNCTLMLWLP